MNDAYYREKAKRAKALYDKGLPFVKVYAPVRDGDKFIVLAKQAPDGVRYDIAGGGVDEGETLEDAIRRELMEELNVEVDIIKEIGMNNETFRTWELDGEKFDIRYEIHVFDTKLKNKLSGSFGLDGEFEKNVKIAGIDKETLMHSVYEFNKLGMKID